jgi:murein DD-endopeptidase MepM/ murein hydrolase activator NlpD
MKHLRRTCLALVAVTLLTPASAATEGKPGEPRTWGNITFVDLAIGESCRYAGKNVKLVAMEKHFCTVDVDGVQAALKVARRTLPGVVNGVRIYVSDNRVVASLTSETLRGRPLLHGATTRDALLALSDPSGPLVDPERFVFPISWKDGYQWSMEEDSHQWAYLAPNRSHEGIDLGMHEARGRVLHPLVAIEAGTVRWVEQKLTAVNEACLLLESAAQPGIWYCYQHLNSERVLVSAGQKVSRGQPLAYIWGDNAWGHLHFAVGGYGPEPTYSQRYRYLLNAFPVLYELWHGDLRLREHSRYRGQWFFARHRGADHNRTYRHAYDPVIGYGWDLGRWCPAERVESERPKEVADTDVSVQLRKTLFRGEAAEATNPQDFYNFLVDVNPGRYLVKARLGSNECDSWQAVSINGMDLGTYVQAKGTFAWTRERTVEVREGRLRLRLALKDADTPAALSALHFERIGDVK